VRCRLRNEIRMKIELREKREHEDPWTCISPSCHRKVRVLGTIDQSCHGPGHLSHDTICGLPSCLDGYV
jgi:hypothetical protein